MEASMREKQEKVDELVHQVEAQEKVRDSNTAETGSYIVYFPCELTGLGLV